MRDIGAIVYNWRSSKRDENGVRPVSERRRIVPMRTEGMV
jgi:hypothetical protein